VLGRLGVSPQREKWADNGLPGERKKKSIKAKHLSLQRIEDREKPPPGREATREAANFRKDTDSCHVWARKGTVTLEERGRPSVLGEIKKKKKFLPDIRLGTEKKINLDGRK